MFRLGVKTALINNYFFTDGANGLGGKFLAKLLHIFRDGIFGVV